MWTTAVSPEQKCDVINEDNSDRKTEDFPVGTYGDATLRLCYITMLGVTDCSKIGEENGCK